MRRFDCGKTFVRLVMMLNWRPGKKGIFSGSRTCPSSMISPVRISFAALSACSGFIRFPEPRSSPAPHFDGQRCVSFGGVQDWAARGAAERHKRPTIIETSLVFIGKKTSHKKAQKTQKTFVIFVPLRSEEHTS